MKQWECRHATLADEVSIVALQVECTHQLGLAFQNDFQLGSYIREVGILDSDLINRRTYYVVEYDHHIIGCGGWCDRPPYSTSYLAKQEAVIAQPMIRTLFVDPDFMRRGVGSTILTAAETDIRRAGYRSVELVTVLSAVNFYRSFGYTKRASSAVELSNGAFLPAIRMGKKFDEQEICSDTPSEN